MLEIKTARFAFTAVDRAGFARSILPEIVLVGRSNVGKSTLINGLGRQSKLARVSSTPGKTREVNYYLLNDQFYLVDLPGYGYANVSHAEKERWGQMIEGYFAASSNIRLVLFLMDIRRDPNDDDRQAAQWMEHNVLPYRLVLTKADKVSKSQRGLAAVNLSDRLGMTFRSRAIVTSSLEKLGRDDMLRAIGEALTTPNNE